MIRFLDLYNQYMTIKEEVDDAISAVMSNSAFIKGPYVTKFEYQFAEYQQVQYCIGVANGTDALEIAIESLQLPKSSEIIVPGNSFIASSEAVARSGHTVVFCDCDRDNYTISIEDVKKRITQKTKAIIAVHLYGHPCDMDSLLQVARENNLHIIEDCAQAHGAEYKGRRVGAIGDIGTFSFYPGKNLGAYGDAGAIVTNNEQLAQKCRMIADHGRIEKYDHEFEGRNSRLDGLQAAILSVKLKYLSKWIEQRRDLAKHYIEQLKNCDSVILPKIEDWCKHVFHLFVVRSNNRDSLKEYLNVRNIQTGIHYPAALPKLKAYAHFGQANDPLICNKYDSSLLSLPIGDHLNRKEITEVCDAVKQFYSRNSI